MADTMAGAVEQILRRMKDNSTRDVLGRKVRRVNHSLFMIDGEAFLSVRSAAALFGEGALGEGRYYEPQRVPKWSGRPSVLKVRGGPLTRRVFHELTKEQHLERAYEMARKAAEQRMAYRRALDSAISRYGDIPRGTQPISGIYNQAFPEGQGTPAGDPGGRQRLHGRVGGALRSVGQENAVARLTSPGDRRSRGQLLLTECQPGFGFST